MAVDFPIRVDIQNVIFGSMLAALPYKREFAAGVVQMLAGQAEANVQDANAANLQQDLYNRTVDQLRQVRRVVGYPAGGDDLYSLSWFLLSFHGWMAIAGLRGIGKIGWARSNDDFTMIQRCLLELGVDCSVTRLRERLLALTDLGSRGADSTLADIDNYLFIEQAKYLSSAAIRTGHRVDLHAPAQRVFISYAHKDREYVDLLVTFLQAHAVRVWYDTSDLKSGGRLDDRLRREIDNVECLVVVLTRNSLGSEYVALEVAAALDMGKNLLPLSLVPLPDLTGMRDPGGRDLCREILRYPVVDASAGTPIEACENVLRSLQRVGSDLSRWTQDEGSHLSLFREMLSGR